MLIVCANLSNLQLARSATRQKEMAVRVALGAGRHRLIRQTLTESVVLSCGGALLGLTLAFAGTRALAHLDSMGIPLLSSVHVDRSALLFTLVVAVLTGIVFGLVPALHIPTYAVHDRLKDNTRASTENRKRAWIRGALAVSEIALACVLVVGAVLLIRSFLRVLDVNLGFRPEQTATLRIDPSSHYSTQTLRNNYYTEALQRVRSVPGIQGAGLTDVLPLGGDRSWGVGAKGQLYDRNHYHEAFVRIVSDGYFGAMGIALKAGRDFSEQDSARMPPVIVINETFARALWPGQNPIGQIIRGAGNVDREVIGVVGDVRHLALEQSSGNEMYLPIRQTGDYAAVELVVRSNLPAAQLATALRAALQPIAPDLPAHQLHAMQQLVDKAVSPRRFIVSLLTGFSAFALVLASLGIYGVISYSVSQRTQEIGIRMAVGASAWDVQRSIIVQTLSLAAMGMAIGTFASWMLTRAIGSLLFEVSATDPVTFISMLVVLSAVAAIAGYLPARRASRIDPMCALRTT
jgi:predicted permease